MEPLGRSQIRHEVLSRFLNEPGLETHPRELARGLNRAAPPVVRELSRLEGLGVLTSRRVGPLRRYQLARSPQAEAVRHLVGIDRATGGASDTVALSHDDRLRRLHARVAEKLRQDPDRVLAIARRNITRWGQIDPRGNRPWMEAWSEILDHDPGETALLLVDSSPRMRELRQSSPFAGVLTVPERLRTLRETE